MQRKIDSHQAIVSQQIFRRAEVIRIDLERALRDTARRNMSGFYWAVAVVFLASGNLFAATQWLPTDAKVDEAVADTTIVAPRHPNVQPLRTQIPFRNFRYPHVNAAEDVTFIADDPAFIGNSYQHGIYRALAAQNDIIALAVFDQPIAPGSDNKFRYIRGLQMDGDDFVFNATLTTGGRGLFHWSDGNIKTIARTRITTLPDRGLPLTGVEYGALKNGRILYYASDNAGTALVLHELSTGKTQVVLRTETSIPGRSGDLFRYFSPQNWLGDNSVVFRAARVEAPHDDPKRHAGNVGVYGWFGVDLARADDFHPSKLLILADWQTPPPPEGRGRFTYFGSAPVVGDLVAFMGETNDAGQKGKGIYCAIIDPDAGEKQVALRHIVDTDTEMESLFAGPFTDFSKWVELTDGAVAFIGYASGYVGVFLYKPASDELFSLCDNREEIEGKKVRRFELGANFLSGNRLALTAHFVDGTSGVYLATIPENSFKRITIGR